MISKYYIGTLNNPNVTVDEFSQFCKRVLSASSFAGQLEKGESGTPHIQFLIGFDTQKRLTAVRKRFDQWHPHLEIAGNAFKSYEYCTKVDTRIEPPVTFGPIPKPSKRVRGDTKAFNDLVLTKGPEALVKSGELSLINYPKVLAAATLYKLNTQKPDDLESLDNWWIFGLPGTGKSRFVRQTYPNHFNKGFNKWWDGYKDGQPVLLDDFGPEHSWMSHHLKNWADHYSFPAEVKNGLTQIRPPQILITSNYTPEEIWPQEKDANLLLAIQRRFKRKHFVALQNPQKD